MTGLRALLGLAACLLLPWYFLQSLTLARALQGVFGGADTASALMQVLHHGRPWLGAVIAGLGLAMAASFMAPGRRQGWLVIGATALGLGPGAVVALLSLPVLLGAGLARVGRFRGDVFLAMSSWPPAWCASR